MERVYRTDLKLLRYFLAVAEELRFSRAVVCLNMSQPPLSIRIRELGSQLGTQFFIRHSRNAVLTHTGEILMEELRRLLVSTSNVLARVEQVDRGEAGRIELGVMGTAMWGRMRPVMRRFLKENPNVEVLFRERMPATRMALLECHELDARIWRMATEPPTGFISLRLHESAFLVAMSKEHHLSSFFTAPLEALRDEYLITVPPVYTDWGFLQRVCQQVGSSPVVIHEVNEPQTVLTMISMGVSITLIAGNYAQMNWLNVIFRPLKEHIPADLYIIYGT